MVFLGSILEVVNGLFVILWHALAEHMSHSQLVVCFSVAFARNLGQSRQLMPILILDCGIISECGKMLGQGCPMRVFSFNCRFVHVDKFFVDLPAQSANTRFISCWVSEKTFR